MAKRQSRKQVGLLERLLDTEPGIKVKIAPATLEQDSIIDLQCKTTDALMAHYPGMHSEEARRLKGRLNVAAAAVMRAFREKRLSASARRPSDELRGPLDLSRGPTFENQFLPSWGNNAHPQAVDATTSPVAYLIDLLTFVQEHVEAQGDADMILTLKTRRPDLFERLIDEAFMNRELPQVEVIIHVLEQLIEEHRQQADSDRTATEDKLLKVRYPIKQFPYEAYWEQIHTVLSHNSLLMGDVARLSDIDSPYFIQAGAHSPWSDAALQQEATLGPVLRALLIEVPYFGTAASQGGNAQSPGPKAQADEPGERYKAFYEDNFGVPNAMHLHKVVSFCQVLQISQDEMESLFGLAAYAPTRSDNVTRNVLAEEVSPALFVARFINSGGAAPVGVVSDAQDPQRHTFENLSDMRFDRIQRLVRVATALKLTYAQADQVVCAAIDAEKRAVAEVRRIKSDDSPLWMTVNTHRALGVFQFLRERFACSAEDFSVLLSDMAVHGIGATASHFDRVFNSDPTSRLVLDGSDFSLSGDDVASKRTVDQLCRGLGINVQTFRYLSRLVMQGQGGDKLQRSVRVVSAFYRVTMLARLLSITTIELLALLETLSPEGLYALQLGGAPQNAMYRSFAQTDTLSVIHAISHCVLWCQEQDLPISWLVQQLLPVETPDVVPQEISALFGELKTQLLPFQAFEQALLDAGVVALPAGEWLKALEQVVDENGLLADTGDPEQDFDPEQYEQFAEREIKTAVDQLAGADHGQLADMDSAEKERLTGIILGVVLRIRSQQWGVVQQSLSQLLRVNADMAIPMVYWAEGTVHQLLESAVAFDPQQSQSDTMKAMLGLVQRMQRCAQIATRFELTPTLFSSLLIRAHRARFGIDAFELSLHTLYHLERYARGLRLAKQSEAQLLGYFSAIEELKDLSANEQRLLRDAAAQRIAAWLGWGIREVLDVAARVSPDGIIRDLTQLRIVVDTKLLSDTTGLSAESLMKLSRLTAYSGTQDYRDAAQEMLSSLESDSAERGNEAELRQSLASRCTVSETRLIARAPDQETTVALKLLDMNNEPVSDIRITWSTDLGILQSHSSYTDEEGVATVRLQAGMKMGSAHVQASYLLDGKAFAPPVVIDCDEETVRVRSIEGRPGNTTPLELAGGQGIYRLAALLVDRYDNNGVDRLVNWSTTIGYFVDNTGETLTDHTGYSRIALRSREPGSGVIRAWYAGKPDDVTVVQVGFADRPYVNSLVLQSALVVDEPITVQAKVLGLDGEPVVGQAMSWSCEGGELVSADQTSDAAGLGRAVLQVGTARRVKVTVTLSTADETAEAYHSKDLEFDVLADATLRQHRKIGSWPLADGISTVEYEIHIATTEGIPVARYPITWSVSEGGTRAAEPAVSLTGSDGIARFDLKSTTTGQRRVTASWGKEQSHSFEQVTFIEPLGLMIEFDGKPLEGEIVFTPPSEGETTHTLTYRLAAGHSLIGQQMSLHVSGRNSAASLGLVISPAPGADNELGNDGVTWTITSRPVALKTDVELKFGFSYDAAYPSNLTDVVIKGVRK
ncbi:Ig-like domain-containing protein [Pseudomonas putida]|uniref:Ig-like domain-containing protein n=1 Tax=Pseudomonas putida TaxID=303 RepID=UPI0018DA2918|nr:Ig-like domain-containing protein [Pseudomonas putida]MBH3459317.1 Ig-like domain-containing protein [Pseudomonas putida]